MSSSDAGQPATHELAESPESLRVRIAQQLVKTGDAEGPPPVTFDLTSGSSISGRIKNIQFKRQLQQLHVRLFAETTHAVLIIPYGGTGPATAQLYEFGHHPEG